jgi:hypothetical protein
MEHWTQDLDVGGGRVVGDACHFVDLLRFLAGCSVVSLYIPKERLEIFASGRTLQLDNFRTLRGFGWPGFRKMRLWSQDKGQNRCAKSFIYAIQNKERSPISLDEIIEVSRISIDLTSRDKII